MDDAVSPSPAAMSAQRDPASAAREFVERAEHDLEALGVRAGRAAWIQANFITHDTEVMAAETNEAWVAAAVTYAKEVPRYEHPDLSEAIARRLRLLKLALTMPAPSDPALTAEIARLATSLESTYGRGRHCDDSGNCRDLEELSTVMRASRDPDSLLNAWLAWRTVSPPMRADYARFAQLMNQGATELGFHDVGAMWRSNYDMDADDFRAELDRLWGQVRPLYEQLHCYVRGELAEFYGNDVVAQNGPIPAHLLGNMWAQSWTNVFDIVAPDNPDPGYDLTELLEESGTDAAGMVRYGERFFTSLGFGPLPDTFWDRSLFVKPADRNVVCHASAWDVEDGNDVRIKMCIQVNAEDFNTIHHELGHNFYQRAYGAQPYLFRGSANDGFHEALGDAVALSVTPGYLVQIGLLDQEPDPTVDIALLLRDALDKIAFLPFGLLVDQWRWRVFSREVSPEEYNTAWWDLRREYQGIMPPTERGEEWFDPGAKYHIPGNTPYTRYFLAAILQFQFHRALCATAGYEGPLNRCSIYGNREAGARLNAMMEMGQSRPWPEALEALTGSREMDATAIIDYFAPLIEWLEEQNAGRACGW
ncbi:MAG: M2 family metallopeptidase [Gemmatimonadales bacterium]